MCFGCFKNKDNKNNKDIQIIIKEKSPVEKVQEIKDTREVKDLIVDDSDPNRMVIKKYLNRFNRQTDEVTNGLEVIEIFKQKTNTTRYDIIWMDLQMPKMNGVKCTQYLRDVLHYKGIIIGITGHVDVDSINDCKTAGMNDILAKPIDKKSLETYVEKYSTKSFIKKID